MNKEEFIEKIGKENYNGFVLFLLDSTQFVTKSDIENYYEEEYIDRFLESEYFLSPIGSEQYD